MCQEPYAIHPADNGGGVIIFGGILDPIYDQISEHSQRSVGVK